MSSGSSPLQLYLQYLEFIEDDYHVDDDIYEVVKICDHFMPQVPTATGRHIDEREESVELEHKVY